MFAAIVSKTDYEKISTMVLEYRGDGFDLMLLRLRSMFEVVTSGHIVALGFLMGWVERGEQMVLAAEHFNRQN